MRRLPTWIRVRIPADGRHDAVRALLERESLHTVCQSALCPNLSECFGAGAATFMILGEACTRNCRFCAVEQGKPSPVDPEEPARVARAALEFELRHVVVTSVTRDDLNDGGAGPFAQTITELRKALPSASIEVLTPDFKGVADSVKTVLRAGPDVFNHNLETVRRLQGNVRPDADYDRSLSVLAVAADWEPGIVVKSGIMVGLGETDDEIVATMNDLLSAGCEALTIGQYLAPSREHAPVARFVRPEVFDGYRETALAMGFRSVAAGPLVRSSYKAGELLQEGRMEEESHLAKSQRSPRRTR